MDISKKLTKKLQDGSIKNCLDFEQWLKKYNIEFNKDLYKLFYNTKRQYLINKGVRFD